jgi:hypothetical protein
MHVEPGTDSSSAKRISATEVDLYWQSEQATGRERLLEELVNKAKRLGWYGDFGNAWADWDVKLVGDRWHDIVIRTATEELGWPKRFTRARCTVINTRFSSVMATAGAVWAIAATITGEPWAIAIGLLACAWTLSSIGRSRRRCLSAVTGLMAAAGERCGLASVLGTPDKADSAPTSAKPVGSRSTTSRTVADDSGIVRV